MSGPRNPGVRNPECGALSGPSGGKAHPLLQASWGGGIFVPCAFRRVAEALGWVLTWVAWVAVPWRRGCGQVGSVAHRVGRVVLGREHPVGGCGDEGSAEEKTRKQRVCVLGGRAGLDVTPVGRDGVCTLCSGAGDTGTGDRGPGGRGRRQAV